MVDVVSALSQSFWEVLSNAPVRTRLADVKARVTHVDDVGATIDVSFTLNGQANDITFQIGPETTALLARQFYNIHQRLVKRRAVPVRLAKRLAQTTGEKVRLNAEQTGRQHTAGRVDPRSSVRRGVTDARV